VPCNLKIHNPVHNLKVGTQFLDSEKVQSNLKIAQIPRLHETETLAIFHACFHKASLEVLSL